MATHSSILAWRISWMGEPGGLQSMGSQRVGHDWATNTYLPAQRAVRDIQLHVSSDKKSGSDWGSCSVSTSCWFWRPSPKYLTPVWVLYVLYGFSLYSSLFFLPVWKFSSSLWGQFCIKRNFYFFNNSCVQWICSFYYFEKKSVLYLNSWKPNLVFFQLGFL